MKPSDELLALIEYRMRAVSIGHLALRYSMEWDDVPSMAIYFNDQQVIEGTATGFTNSAIEAAIVHCRALLEFAGLAGSTSTKLREVCGARRTDDEAIENCPGLRKVTVAEATAYYPGSAVEAESALAYVIYLANKGLAHTTSPFEAYRRSSPTASTSLVASRRRNMQYEDGHVRLNLLLQRTASPPAERERWASQTK